MEELQMLGAREVGKILGVNANLVYKLWHSGKLDYWCLNGTLKTNIRAIASFLDRYRNMDMAAQAE